MPDHELSPILERLSALCAAVAFLSDQIETVDQRLLLLEARQQRADQDVQEQLARLRRGVIAARRRQHHLEVVR